MFIFTPDIQFLCLSESLSWLRNATPRPQGLPPCGAQHQLWGVLKIFLTCPVEAMATKTGLGQKSLHCIFFSGASCSLLAHGEEWWPHFTSHVLVLLAALAEHSSCPGTLGAPWLRTQFAPIYTPAHPHLAAVWPCGTERMHVRNKKFKYFLFMTECK